MEALGPYYGLSCCMRILAVGVPDFPTAEQKVQLDMVKMLGLPTKASEEVNYC